MPTCIDREEVRRLTGDGAVLVEVLPAKEYQQLHVSGAINIPLTKLNRDTTVRLRDARAIVTYCHDYQ